MAMGAAAALLLLLPPGAARASPSRSVRGFTRGGQPYVALRDLAFYGCRLSYADTTHILLTSAYLRLDFERDSRRMTLQNRQIWLHYPVVKIGRTLALHRLDADRTLDPLLRSHLYLRARPVRTIVLDPGHGGADSGAAGARRVLEKLVVLDIAQRVKRQLAGSGLDVRLTRADDTFLELNTRSLLATRWRADAFISIHLNAAPDRNAAGIETYVLTSPGAPSSNGGGTPSAGASTYDANARDAQNVILGFHLQRRMVEAAGAADRGLRRARFAVLKNAPCPAALVECGYLSNRAEEGKFATAEYRETLASGIAGGIRDSVTAAQQAQLTAP